MLFDKATIELLKRTLLKDGYINLPARGESMFPLIKHSDICRFCQLDHISLQKGDIVLYWAESGQLVAHRFIKTEYLQGELQYIFKGDTNLGFDLPVNRDRLIGKLEFIQRGNKKIMINEFFIYLWGNLILFSPVISGLLRNYLKKRNIIQY